MNATFSCLHQHWLGDGRIVHKSLENGIFKNDALVRFTRRNHRAFHCRSCCYPFVLFCVMCDLGVLGDWAPLNCRCYLDGWEELLAPEEWLAEVDTLSWEKPLWHDSRLDNDPLKKYSWENYQWNYSTVSWDTWQGFQYAPTSDEECRLLRSETSATFCLNWSNERTILAAPCQYRRLLFSNWLPTSNFIETC